MWLMVMFDLPVATKKQRYRYTRFRNFLLDQGFAMAQFSVYYRFMSGKEAVESAIKRIRPKVPPQGRVDMLTITDKQYENIVSIYGETKPKIAGPVQLALF